MRYTLETNCVIKCKFSLWGIKLSRSKHLENLSVPSVPRIKVVLAGNLSAGKSQLANRITSNRFNEQSAPTNGLEYYSVEQQNYLLNIWDISGNPRFESLLPGYLRDTAICLYCVDLSQPLDSTEIQKKISGLKSDYPEINIILVGTKSDIASDNSRDQFNSIESKDIKCKEVTSAKTGDGIENLKTGISRIVGPVEALPVHSNSTPSTSTTTIPPHVSNEPKTPSSRKLLGLVLFFFLLTLTSIFVSAPLAIVTSLVVLTSIIAIACLYTLSRGQQQETHRVPRALFEATRDVADRLGFSPTNSHKMYADLAQGNQGSVPTACIQPAGNSDPIQHTKLFPKPQPKSVEPTDNTLVVAAGM